MKIIYKKISSNKYNILLVSNNNKYVDYFGYKLVYTGKNTFFFLDFTLLKKYIKNGLKLNLELNSLCFALNE